ncbi:hypothetical protein RJ639_038582 [Escallonia herrerae]|uniref:Uncharacterized protein n=1 Tax=Escallonia herrerae TaxID=1293975 RepID=A0AA89B3W5_9ASTE|nr:hypothetical protein RJ639_038582 [Escallonia herrerae]
MDSKLDPFYTKKETGVASSSLNGLPRGIIEARSDLELKPLWSTSSSKLKVNISSPHNLLAIPVGIKQKSNVDAIVQKFLSENFTVILFHYDGKVDGWWDLDWSNKAIHIVAQKQTKWWFAKRFLHPAVVSIYDYIFLWDEDLGVENFHPGRYLEIMKSEGLEISQPALDPNSTGIHHRITIRKRTKKFHRRVYDDRGSVKCSDASDGPPCTGTQKVSIVFAGLSKEWRLCSQDLPGIVIFKIPLLFSNPCITSSNILKTALKEIWVLHNDLVHGWGMDMKLGYCAQGDRTKKVGIIDSEYIVHQSIQTLGGTSTRKASDPEKSVKKHAVDVRSEIRRQSTSELQTFKERWEQAAEEDKNWVDPFRRKRRRKQRRSQRLNI